MVEIQHFWTIWTATCRNHNLLTHNGFFNAICTKYQDRIFILDMSTTMINRNFITVIKARVRFNLLLNNFMRTLQHLLHGELTPIAHFFKHWVTAITDNIRHCLTQCFTWNGAHMSTVTAKLLTNIYYRNTLT